MTQSPVVDELETELSYQLNTNNMNNLQIETLDEFIENVRHGAKFIDILVRKDGKETRYQADFLKDLKSNRDSIYKKPDKTCPIEQDMLSVIHELREALHKISRRPDLPNPKRDADWENCMKWSSYEAKQALAASEKYAKEKL